jgi:hypothetical protein
MRSGTSRPLSTITAAVRANTTRQVSGRLVRQPPRLDLPCVVPLHVVAGLDQSALRGLRPPRGVHVELAYSGRQRTCGRGLMHLLRIGITRGTTPAERARRASAQQD